MIQSAPTDLGIEVGMEAGELLLRLLHLLSVRTVTFVQYRAAHPFVNRVVGSVDEQLHLLISSHADGEFREAWLPDYEILFAKRLAEGAEMTKLIAAAVQHDERQKDRIRTTFPSDQVSSSTIEILLQQRPEWTLAASSRVTTESDRLFHLPMMDFHCPVSEKNLALVAAALVAIGQEKGAIVETGRSYHYYGFELLTEDAWESFLGKCLLLSPLTDARYIGHRLIDKECVVRLAPSPGKDKQPKVVHLLGLQSVSS
jgi:hypothetical protein